MKSEGTGYIEIDLTFPVFKKPLSVSKYIDLLYEALEQKYPEAKRCVRSNRNNYNDRKRILHQFQNYLSTKGQIKISPDEALLEGFVEYLLESGNTKRRATDSATRIRTLTNSFPKKVLKRKLLSARELKRATRFDHLSPESKQVLVEFLKNGRKVKQGRQGKAPELSNQIYSEKNRASTIDDVLQFLKTIGKTDLFNVTKEDAEKYFEKAAARGKRDYAANRLVEIRKIYSILQAKGKITENPLEGYRQKTSNVNSDFVPPECMALLQDLDSVDWDDLFHIQARLICFGLLYDFALRRSEACGLVLDDIVVNKFVEVQLRPEIQKGNNKDLVVLYSCFPETRKLMARFLELRKQLSLKTDSLLINTRRRALSPDGCGEIVKLHSEKLGVRTYQNNRPTPHTFRHTFGTLNTDTIGLKLRPDRVSRRLRHHSLDFTYRVYVTNNQYLDKLKHEAQFGSDGEGEGDCIGNGSTLDPLGRLLTEAQALKRLRPFCVTLKALRGVGEEKGFIQERDGVCSYAENAIENLLQNFETKESAMKMLGLTKSGFWDWYTRNGLKPVNIGKVSLWRREDILGEIRREAG